jgi:hypothetical protein
MTDLEKIHQRMSSGEPFRYRDLCALLSDKNDISRLADREIQRWRRAGRISCERRGRDTFWTLTVKEGK